MSQAIFWVFASIGILVTFFVMPVAAIMLCFEARSWTLGRSVLKIIHEHQQKEYMLVSEIAQVLEDNGTFKYISKLKDKFPESRHKYIFKFLEDAPGFLITDACRMASRAGWIINVGNLLPCYQLSDKGRKAFQPETI